MTTTVTATSRSAVPRSRKVTRARSASLTMLRIESRLFLRQPVGIVWGLLMPLVAFIILGVIPATGQPQDYLDGLSYRAVYQPILIVVALAMLALNGLTPILGSYRERGVLRRLRATPMPPQRLLAALVVIHLVVAVAAAAIILLAGTIAFDVALPHPFAGWLLMYVLTCAAVLGLGVMVAALSPSGKLANALGAILFFPLAFLAGLWIPQQVMPSLLRDISEYSPLGAAMRATTQLSHGQFPSVAPLLALAAYAVAFCYLAVRYFRWE